MKDNKNLRFIISAIVLFAAFLFVTLWTPGSGVPLKSPLARLPLDIGAWTGRELYMTPEVLDVVGVDDYVMRLYYLDATAERGGVAAPVNLYIGYYESQSRGRTYHSPKNCMPGSGWEIVDTKTAAVRLAGEVKTVNRVIIQKGLEKQMVLYWYQDRGRTIANEYYAKGYLVLDSITMRRTDGALIRMVAPVTGTGTDAEEAAFRHISSFVDEIYPRILEHLPEAG